MFILKNTVRPKRSEKYLSDTAGAGIAYLLQHVYGPIYDQQISKIAAQNGDRTAFRVLEYGCGGGMNLIWIVRRLLDRQLKLDFACGTDFSAKMVEAAVKESSFSLPANAREKVSFHAVANENLDRDLPKELGRPLADLQNSFHLIVGVNTFRYCFDWVPRTSRPATSSLCSARAAAPS